MSKARADILRNISKAAGSSDQPIGDVPSLIAERLSLHARGPIPVFTEPPLARFITKLENASGTVQTIEDIAALPLAVEEYLARWKIARNMVAASSALLNDLVWPEGVTLAQRNAQADDMTALTVAYAGIAETGTLVLCSSRATPTTLNFLPDNYLCVIKQADIYPCMEDVWELLRRQGKKMPRSINFITGPSRTADVEQTIQLGAHGPPA